MGLLAAGWERVPLPAEHVAGLVVAALLQRVWPRPLLPTSAARAGWALLGAGVALEVWAVGGRGGEPLERPSRLATSGAQSWSRNPMYVGWSLLHLGGGLVARSPWALATWPPAVALVHGQVMREERELERRFGPEFSAYRARVPRYVPLPRRRT